MVRTTFADAVRHFRATKLQTLEPSTRVTYSERVNVLLLPRFGEVPLDELYGESLAKFDADLVRRELAPSTRRNIHIVFRSVLRATVDASLLESMPRMPRLPRVGRKVTKQLRRGDVEAILSKTPDNTRLAFALAAFAGLRAGEVRGLRWPDVDLKAGTITIRCSISRREE